MNCSKLQYSNIEKDFLKAVQFIDEKKNAEAIELLEKIISEKPDFIEAYVNLTYLYTEKNLARAEQYGNKAVGLISENDTVFKKNNIHSQAYINLSYIFIKRYKSYMKSDRYKDASASLIKAIQLLKRGSSLTDSSDYSATIEKLETFMRE
ncbi:MAG: hypothetical protein KAS39_03310 [Actinomycetia bacterium]|nr:hypothetical protein [Actinomycetes bacterium]